MNRKSVLVKIVVCLAIILITSYGINEIMARKYNFINDDLNNINNRVIKTDTSKTLMLSVIEKEKLKLKKNKESGDTILEGELVVEIHNLSDKEMAFLDLQVHNLLFINKKSNQQFIPFHICACVNFTKSRSLPGFKLEPGGKKTISFSIWDCDGSSFGVPEPGNYDVIYRIITKKSMQFNSLYKSFLSGNRSKPPHKLKGPCNNLFQMDYFWKDAFSSEPIQVKIK